MQFEVSMHTCIMLHMYHTYVQYAYICVCVCSVYIVHPGVWYAYVHVYMVEKAIITITAVKTSKHSEKN